MLNEHKVVYTDCINSDRISSIDINGSQSPFSNAYIIFGANYTVSGRYHSIVGVNRNMDSSVRSPISRTNNKIIMKDQIYPEDSPASRNIKAIIKSSDDAIEQKAEDTNGSHGDGNLSIPVYGNIYPFGEMNVKVGNKNTAHAFILQTNI